MNMDEDCATVAEICNKIHEQNTLVAWYEMLDATLVKILDALDNLNEALDRTSARQANPAQPKATPLARSESVHTPTGWLYAFLKQEVPHD